MHHHHTINAQNESKTLLVIVLTLLTMIAEIIYGYWTNSMALLADGWHMGTHVLALSLTYAAYVLIRKFDGSPRFKHGPEKVGTLAAYTSAIFLGLTGVWIIIEAGERFFHPLTIEFNEAIMVAAIGLAVNSACIGIMTGHRHNEAEPAHDCNFKAAYYHILADALTSILAIAALLAGKYGNWLYMDAAVGILGGVLILRWAIGLLKNTMVILLDMRQE